MIVWNHFFCALLLLGTIGFGIAQRKQGRNIAVGNEGKTPANFDCPEEFGYYPHPTDCTQYYVCVFGGALLESCTGGLMYSHELQTCDWPRNVGCDGLEAVSISSPGGGVSVSVQPASRVSAPEQRVRYTVVPSPQPQPVVSSRGQSRQLHATVHERVHERDRVHAQDIISKQQQQQLYAEAEDVLPPAEEIENDRQQRVYRGQPATVGQVQRDRDGLRHTNAIPSSNRAEKIGVISFGTQQQQQPVQQYRNYTLYIDNSLTDDLTTKRRRKRQTRHRLAPIDRSTADSSVSWTRHVPVAHLVYQQPKQQYQNHRLNSMDVQLSQVRYKQPQQQSEYSAILSGDQTEFQPFSPNLLAYKTQQLTPTQVKSNPYVLPKVIKPAGAYQYFNTDPRSHFPKTGDNENYSYFNIGAVGTTPSVTYVPPNQSKVTQGYYQQNSQPIVYKNQFRPIINTPSHVQFVNQPKQMPEKQEYAPQNEEQRKHIPLNHKPEESEEESEEENEEEDEQEEQSSEKSQDSSSIKPEFPSPPPYFYKSTNKYENIENPFADPNFDFDKFISKIRGNSENPSNNKQITTEANFQMITTQNDSKQKIIHSKVTPIIDLRTPVAFSSPSNKKKIVKPSTEEDYYYDDDEEEIYEIPPKKPYIKYEHETPSKTISTTKAYSTINKNHSPSSQVNVQNNKKIANSHLSSAVTVRTEEKKQKPSKDKEHHEITHQNVKPDDDEYEYYDDYDYDSEEEKDEKYEQSQIKKPSVTITTPKPINTKHAYHPKISIPLVNNHKVRPAHYETIIYQNKSQNDPSKRIKYFEKAKEMRPLSSQTIHHKHITSPSPKITETTHKITTIEIPNRQTTRLLTTTLRPRDRDSTTRKTNTKNSSRLEETSVSTQSHATGASQSTPSGRTLYNGSQHYDPTQYDPYYTLYEDDVELYRDVDYTQQQQYTNNRAQPQQVYRGTPAPISVPVQSTLQEESVPQRNSAYYSTQAQDVYSAAQEYQEDNYNTQVDDQTNYRQPSRQPSRGDRNELSYYVESTAKSTTIRTTTTTTTTTTPRPIPVQKQSVVPSKNRSPIIATANQTRPQSIIITLSATPGQNSPKTLSSINTTTIETKNETDSSTPKSPTRFISLSTGFNYRQTDSKSELTPVTYKPHFTQISSTTDFSVGNRPAPFSLTKLPNAETKSVIFRLSSQLSALSPNVSETDNQASILYKQSTESPSKREIFTDKSRFANAHEKSTDGPHVVPTTYSPSKSLLASLLPRRSSSKSFENQEESSELQSVSILPRKTIIADSSSKFNTESSTVHQRQSITVENPITDRSRFETNDKPVKTIIRKLPLRVESTSKSPSTERIKEQRKIISKIHFGNSYTSPEKINNLATTPSLFSTTSDYADSSSQESNSEKSNAYRDIPDIKRPVTAHYITTDLTTSQRPHFRFPTIDVTTVRSNSIKYLSSTTEEASSAENTHTNEDNSSERQYVRSPVNYKSAFTTERGNSVKYTPNTFDTEYIDSLEHAPLPKIQSRFSFISKYNNSEERRNPVQYINISKKFGTNNLNSANSSFVKFEVSENPVILSTSTTQKTTTSNFFDSYIRKNLTNHVDKLTNSEYIDNNEDVSSSEKFNSRFSLLFRSTTERGNFNTQTSISTTEKVIVNNQKAFPKFSFNSNPSSSSGHSNKYTTSTTEKLFEVKDSSNNHKPIFRFVYNPSPTATTEQTKTIKMIQNEKPRFNTSTQRYIPTSTEQTSTSKSLYPHSTTTTEQPSTIKLSLITSTSTEHYATSTFSTIATKLNTTAHITENQTAKRYRFTEKSNEDSDVDLRLRNMLFLNRNVKPFKATAELPSLSEILSDPSEPVKEKDTLPTYKPKPYPLTDTIRNRTSADASRNVTLPVRLSRVNTAIKSLTAFGGTRRNSQSPKCNENQTTPDTKCNEIQKQRNNNRGRGSAHYTSAGAGDNLSVNRGTPATPRSRPTLKPSTSIVSKASEYIDIYRYPPYRPDSIYPQPQVDKTAAKCRKDVCLLPDCSCGGKEIPGDLPVEEVPQIVLMTFDDAVNDLNRGIYSELFEQGRTNPNGCPISATFYVSHEWTDYSQVQNLYADGHELASHTVSHSFGEQFSQKKWNREVAGQREILAAYGGVHLEDVRGMRAPFLSVGGNKMFKMLYDSNFTYDSSLPVYENRPPSWPYTLDYKLFHDCMIPPCPTRSYPGVWEVPMVMWQDLNGGRCSMGDACSNPPDSDGVYKMLMKNFERHYTTNRAPFGLFYHAAWFTQPHHKEGFIRFLDFLVSKDDVFLVTNWQAIQWVREPTPLNRIKSFPGFQCHYHDRPKRCNNPKVCNLWHKSGVRYMKTCQPCPDIYPWTGKTGIRSSRIDNDIED